MQPKKNIALTRNMGVANATGEYIAFIDDDEYADPDWLSTLYAALHKYEADVVFGQVIGVLPDDTPEWMRRGGFFKGYSRITGSERMHGATNNAFMRSSKIEDRNAAFDSKYGLTGGEDTDFFQRLRFAGARLVWCNEAIVREIVAPERMNVRWLIRRAYRGGQVFAEICVKHAGWLGRLRWLVYRFFLALVALLGGLLGWPIKREWGVHCFLKVASNIGQVSTMFSHRYEEYGDN
jgi:succinoglycan biosynthesis protein ExoM